MSVPRRRIGFVVDHPKRDLPGAMMVAHALAARGIETALVPLYDQAVDVPLLGLDGLVINYARPVNLELAQGYHGAGLPLWVLDTEGGVVNEDGGPNAPSRHAEYIRESGYADILSGYFFWGGTVRDAFRSAKVMPSDNLHLTGCPRFDYAASKWRDLLTFKQQDYILVNANFVLVNPRFAKSAEQEIEAAVAAGWDHKYFLQLMSDLEAVWRGCLDTIRQLALKFPDKQFLLRPHPFEDASSYVRIFADLPNVVVDGSGSVFPVIKNSACILHVNCGTSIDGILLDKIPFAMEFLNTSHLRQHGPLPGRVSRPIGSIEELYAAIENLKDESERFDFAGVHAAYIEPWFYLNDGNASGRVADVLDSATEGRGKRKPMVARSLASSRKSPRVAQRAQSLAANIIGSRAAATIRAYFQPNRREKMLLVPEVSKGVQQIAKHVGQNAPSVSVARHPLTGAPLSSIIVSPS